MAAAASTPGAVSGTNSASTVATPVISGRADPHDREPRRREDRLAEERPDRQTEVDRQRRDVDRLAAPLLGREVADGGQRRDEEQRLADAVAPPARR